MLTSSPVIVMQLPEQLTAKGTPDFLRDLFPLLESNRPRIVLDCSQVRFMDSAGVQFLLYCLEEVLKRDGDLKLAAISTEAEVILELLRAGRVFEAFSTSEEAVRSFNPSPVDALPQNMPSRSRGVRDLRPLKEAS